MHCEGSFSRSHTYAGSDVLTCAMVESVGVSAARTWDAANGARVRRTAQAIRV